MSSPLAKKVSRLETSPVTWAGAVRLRARLKALNQRDVARELNMDPSTLNKYAAGTRSPDPDTLVRICRVLGVSADDLLGLKLERPAAAAKGAAAEPEDDTGLIRRRILGMLAKLEKGDLKKSDRELLEDLDRRVAALEKKRAAS